MTTTAQKLKPEAVILIPIDQCHKSPTQPRRRGADKLDEDFVASIREKGILQPIVTRVRKAGGWEIVFGHRRHEGSVLAKAETIPAIVREMSDDDVFDAQLIENVHRNDMHPLDEADGFKRMVDRGRTAQQIAEKIGRPATYVAQRLKLCELSKEVRAALDKETISLGVAVLLARVPGSLQAEALEEVDDEWGEGQVSVADAKKTLEAAYLLRLDQAPFDIASATLVPKAGACTTCPKRSGQQRELFPDAARADLCIDRSCYRDKLDALWQIRVKEAKTGGPQVLEGKAAQTALGYSGGYRKLTDMEWLDNGKTKTVREILGKTLPAVTLARDSNGTVFELVKRTDVDKVLKRTTPPARAASDDRWRKDEQRRKAKQKLQGLVVDLAIAEAVGRHDHLDDAELILLLTEYLVDNSWQHAATIVSSRKLDEQGGKKKAGSNPTNRLADYLGSLSKPSDVASLALELILRELAPDGYASADPGWTRTLKALGVDLAAIEKKVAAEAKATKGTKSKIKAKTAEKKAT